MQEPQLFNNDEPIEEPEPMSQADIDARIARLRASNRARYDREDARDAPVGNNEEPDHTDVYDDLGGHPGDNSSFLREDNPVGAVVMPSLVRKPRERPRAEGPNHPATPASLDHNLTPEQLAINAAGIEDARNALKNNPDTTDN